MSADSARPSSRSRRSRKACSGSAPKTETLAAPGGDGLRCRFELVGDPAELPPQYSLAARVGELGGSVAVETAPGEGTVVAVRLPLIGGAAAPRGSGTDG